MISQQYCVWARLRLLSPRPIRGPYIQQVRKTLKAVDTGAFNTTKRSLLASLDARLVVVSDDEHPGGTIAIDAHRTASLAGFVPLDADGDPLPPELLQITSEAGIKYPVINPSMLGLLLNISTRARVATGDAVLIAGLIITGSQDKAVLVRGIGPSLAAAGVTSPLQDPTLELFNSGGQMIASNNDWAETQAWARRWSRLR